MHPPISSSCLGNTHTFQPATPPSLLSFSFFNLLCSLWGGPTLLKHSPQLPLTPSALPSTQMAPITLYACVTGSELRTEKLMSPASLLLQTEGNKGRKRLKVGRQAGETTGKMGQFSHSAGWVHYYSGLLRGVRWLPRLPILPDAEPTVRKHYFQWVNCNLYLDMDYQRTILCRDLDTNSSTIANEMQVYCAREASRCADLVHGGDRTREEMQLINMPFNASRRHCLPFEEYTPGSVEWPLPNSAAPTTAAERLRSSDEHTQRMMGKHQAASDFLTRAGSDLAKLQAAIQAADYAVMDAGDFIKAQEHNREILVKSVYSALDKFVDVADTIRTPLEVPPTPHHVASQGSYKSTAQIGVTAPRSHTTDMLPPPSRAPQHQARSVQPHGSQDPQQRQRHDNGSRQQQQNYWSRQQPQRHSSRQSSRSSQDAYIYSDDRSRSYIPSHDAETFGAATAAVNTSNWVDDPWRDTPVEEDIAPARRQRNRSRDRTSGSLSHRENAEGHNTGDDQRPR